MEAFPVYLLIFACVAVASYMVVEAVRGLGRGKTSSPFNSTSDWTPAPEHEPERPPAGTPLIDYEMRIVTAHLEAGETLEGCARGFFSPPRRQDYKIGTGVEKLPLLMAVSSRRLLLFEVTVLKVHRYRFIPFDAIQYLHPPKPGVFGTSGEMRFGLLSGAEYQVRFNGPLFSPEGMRQEQRLAAYLRRLAPRYDASRAAA